MVRAGYIIASHKVMLEGKPLGYFYVPAKYDNFVLTYDWMFPTTAAGPQNSGAFIFIQPPHKN